MEFVESDDGPPHRRPPALDDRIWRHPSEMGGGAPPGRPRKPRKTIPQRSAWIAVVVAALGASVLTTGLLVAFGPVRHRDAITTRATVLPGEAPVTPTEPVVAIAERVRPAIALVKVHKPSGNVSGSAVMFLADGHLLTNAHVVADADTIRVLMSSGIELPGRVIGSDPVTDTAVVKVDGGSSFPVADLGSAANLKVGQTAITMGSPLALAGGPSVTVGVISALHRSVRTRSTVSLFDMIQTDAPISPGSSGGALLDGAGRVIGITTAMAVSDVGPEGLGFATPVDVARSVADELMTTGRATHAWMGIEGSDLDGAMAHDLAVAGGAMINSLKDGGPAAAAGLAVRDVIVAIDGAPVGSMNSLVVALRKHRPGESMAVEVIRDRQRWTKNVTVAERPDTP
ncbi:MAG: S1C family serine protease [Acidimicrobiales bacterium]